AEVRRLIDEVYDRTIKLLELNRDKLVALAEALLSDEVIEFHEMMRIIGIDPAKKQQPEAVERTNGRHFALKEDITTDADIIEEDENQSNAEDKPEETNDSHPQE